MSRGYTAAILKQPLTIDTNYRFFAPSPTPSAEDTKSGDIAPFHTWAY